jgi:hypothetical protein
MYNTKSEHSANKFETFQLCSAHRRCRRTPPATFHLVYKIYRGTSRYREVRQEGN